MNPIYSHAKRERQEVFCCGYWYARWRFAGVEGGRAKTWSKRHARTCRTCGRALPWPINYEPPKTSAPVRYWRRKAVKNSRLGLRTNGQPWKRQFLSRAEARERRLERWHARCAALKAAGLTTRGTAPKKQNKRVREQAWREVRAAMPIATRDWESIAVGLQEK